MCCTNTEGTKEAFQALIRSLHCRIHSANNTFTVRVSVREVDLNLFERAFIKTGLSGGALQSHNGHDTNKNKYI